MPHQAPSWQVKTLNSILGSTIRQMSPSSLDFSLVRRSLQLLDHATLASVRAAGIARKARYGGIECDVIEPGHGDVQMTLFYVHGGGFCLHMPPTYRLFGRRLANLLGARVIVPDYRLAPENPYPGGLEDCINAYGEVRNAMAGQALAIAGDSAGGNLAVAVLLRAREQRIAMPDCGVLFSAFLDMTCSGESHRANRAHEPMIAPHMLKLMAAAYAPDEQQRAHPEVSPLYADLAGLCPLKIIAGSTELIRDDSVRLHHQAVLAGVPAELELWTQQPHFFPMFSFLPEAQRCLQSVAQYVQGHTGNKA